MLDEDCDNEENTGDGNEPQLLLQRMLVVMLMFMMMFVRTTFAMIVLMCHIFCIYSFLGARMRLSEGKANLFAFAEREHLRGFQLQR